MANDTQSFLQEFWENLGTPEEPPPLPKEVEKFFKSLGYGMTAGMVTGAVFGWKDTKNPKIPSPPDLPRNPHARATYFVTRGIMAYGVRFSVFTGIFTLTDILCSKFREGKEDFINTTVAGSLTSLLFGALKYDNITGLVAAGFGGSLACIGGYVKDSLQEFVEKERETRKRENPQLVTKLDTVIKRLEEENERSLKDIKDSFDSKGSDP
ncbi:hypothetical protein GpartN1_g236.t1 [Galdieria partita]|uniref:Complex I assembly factor TIMMDC1, mitochondrial n=1 Tax=Galdieria partita TaxID=83374 RepID=A0A9C7PQ63_9RHOD|nr:hypothetical protein GpartN1_g236.t1 [Galdieria partita]